MRSIAGTWRVQLHINGALQIDAPVEVKPVRDPLFNRPPNPITIALDPPSPVPSDVVFCRVTSDLVKEDPDYDAVRYRYQWRVGPTIVRDVTIAALSDAIPRNTFLSTGLAICTVTPSDASLSGSPAEIRFACRADFDGSGSRDVQDIFVFLNAWFGSLPSGDFNGVSGITTQDIFDFLNSWFAGCA